MQEEGTEGHEGTEGNEANEANEGNEGHSLPLSPSCRNVLCVGHSARDHRQVSRRLLRHQLVGAVNVAQCRLYSWIHVVQRTVYRYPGHDHPQ